MSYTALYRKFRPNEFEDVKGQEHIITTLRNQVNADRVGHAYLFCGTRGTGKTTVAKILGKAVNCESPIEGSPCGECKMCQEISSGASLNVIEIDAASNNGVEHIRTIREEVEYRPPHGKYKVYIIDEAHMLTPGAFNALLKTLEEPPEYVVFILATTELHKVPITILSRCQHYDFKRITIETIADRLSELMHIENVEVEERAIRYIAKVADGSMRDALSLLDQCTAFYMGQTLTYDNVLKVLGAVDTQVFSRLIRAVMNCDVAQSLSVVDELVMQGREITQLVNDFIWYLRNLLLVKSADNLEDVLDISSENLLQLREEANQMQVESILRYIRILSELSKSIKDATQRRVLLDIAIIKLCNPSTEKDYDSITERVRVIEEKVENGSIMQASPKEERVVEVEPPLVLEAIPEEVKKIAANFQGVVNRIESPAIRNSVKKAIVSVGKGGSLRLVFDNNYIYNELNQAPNIKVIKDTIIQCTGKSVEIEIASEQSGVRTADVRNLIGIPIEQE